MKREFRVTIETKDGMVMQWFTTDQQEARDEFHANMDMNNDGKIVRLVLDYGTSDKDGTFFPCNTLRTYVKE